MKRYHLGVSSSIIFCLGIIQPQVLFVLASQSLSGKPWSSHVGRYQSDGRDLRSKVLRFYGGGGSNDSPHRVDRELVLGKDRELIHFAIDLKWVWGIITDKQTYINFVKSSWRGIRNLAGVTNGGKEFRDIAVEILHYIRSVNHESTVKLFLGSIKMAEWLAANTERLVLVYIEDVSTKSNFECCMNYRRALSDPLLGDFINDKVQKIFSSSDFSASALKLYFSVRVLRRVLRA